jgi:hypothetical protein
MGVIELQSEIKQEIALYGLNSQLMHVFMYVASFEIRYDTFLAIYKQDLISEEKFERVMVMGKGYF